MAVSAYSAGSVGFDGLFVIKPDGTMQVQSGIGNLGTESVFDVHRVAAELVGMPWEKVEVVWGNTAKYLPSTCNQGGSQTTHAMTRAAHAAGMDAKKKLQEIAAKTLGGASESYQLADGRVFSGGRSMTLAQAAKKAIELGGVYDGHELPKDINAATKASADALAGQGLMGVARDSYPREGTSKSYVATFAEVEVDVETGHYQVLDLLAVADVGTVIHPRNLGGQILGGTMLGLGHALTQKWVYDQHYGVPLARRFYQTRPPTTSTRRRRCVGRARPDPRHRSARGVGEALVGRLRAVVKCDCRGGRRRGVQAVARHGGHHPHGARRRARHARKLTANI
jgi:CO/xanthine dehydrogenase Mo-binding subunit